MWHHLYLICPPWPFQCHILIFLKHTHLSHGGSWVWYPHWLYFSNISRWGQQIEGGFPATVFWVLYQDSPTCLYIIFLYQVNPPLITLYVTLPRVIKSFTRGGNTPFHWHHHPPILSLHLPLPRPISLTFWFYHIVSAVFPCETVVKSNTIYQSFHTLLSFTSLGGIIPLFYSQYYLFNIHSPFPNS